jgi:hypothetical protein
MWPSSRFGLAMADLKNKKGVVFQLGCNREENLDDWTFSNIFLKFIYLFQIVILKKSANLAIFA